MIIKNVRFNNFGIYGGEAEFDLAPRTDHQFTRPIILFSGRNGSGKTTFVEGIRLCLHGSLALGDRVSQRRYNEHLLKRIYRPFREDAVAPDTASITLEFDFVRQGGRRSYVVERSWRRTSMSVTEHLSVVESDPEMDEAGRPPEGVPEDQYDSFLRDLIPPSSSELFFFDGEKIDRLTKKEESSNILARSVKSLLGLHLVERLDADLDVFVTRHAGSQESDIQSELEEVSTQLLTLRQRRETLQQQHEEKDHELQSKAAAIRHQEQRIKSEGGAYAARRSELEQRRELLEQKRETQRKRVQDLVDGVMPFAVAPTMCRKVLERLDVERRYQQWKTSEQLINHQVEAFASQLDHEAFWEEAGIEQNEDARQRLLKALTQMLRQSNPAAPVDPHEIVIQTSERERGRLTNWIDDALHLVPARFAEATQQLIQLNEDLEVVNDELAKVPDDLILQPLVETLNELVKEQQALRKEDQQLVDEIGAVEYQLEQTVSVHERLKDRLKEEQQENQRIQLALRSQRAFREYAWKLKQKKLALLGHSITKRFNQLCRKETILDDVSIDPQSFSVVLHRAGEQFDREELSAGERQLFAIATIWGLREVSGVPMPVVIDTPLGRLDRAHRQSMIQTYLPRASHQVIVLATDAEVDHQTLREIEPALSHAYRLRFDDAQSRTVVDEVDVTDGQQNLLEEMVVA